MLLLASILFSMYGPFCNCEPPSQDIFGNYVDMFYIAPLPQVPGRTPKASVNFAGNTAAQIKRVGPTTGSTANQFKAELRSPTRPLVPRAAVQSNSRKKKNESVASGLAE